MNKQQQQTMKQQQRQPDQTATSSTSCCETSSSTSFSTTPNPNPNNRNKSVSFGVVRIRDHERILVPTDNNNDSSFNNNNNNTGGEDNNFASLGIGWKHAETSHRIHVDEIEQMKEEQAKRHEQLMESVSMDFTIDEKNELRPLPVEERLQVLNEYGYSTKEVLNQRTKERKEKKQKRKKNKNNRSKGIFKFLFQPFRK